MPELEKKSPSKQPFISHYTIFMILFLILVLLATGWWAVSSYQPPQVPTAVVYRPSATLTPTNTLTPTLTFTPSRTPRPTWTLRPRLTDTPTTTPTPSQTSTPTRLPTITRAVPGQFNDRYRLVPWTADLADQAAQMADEYPDIVFPTSNEKSKPAYHAAYKASADAYREALLRFPDDPRAVRWQWKLAYALAQIGDPTAAQLYAGFIQGALKKGDLRSEDLPEWFHLQEPRLTLQVDNIPTEPGQLNQDLIKISEGGVYLWLLETPANIQVQPLNQVFNFDSAAKTVHLLGDFTGDGKTEAAIYQPDTDQPTVLAAPRLFSLSGSQPQELSVQPIPPKDLRADFSPSLSADQEGNLSVTANLFKACPVSMRRAYSWNGTQFVPSPTQFQVLPQASYEQYCDLVLRHALSSWSASENLALIEALLPVWPPETGLDGLPYPADAKDELRYRLGIFQALTGQSDKAMKTLQDLVKTPAVPGSAWAAASGEFLKNYPSPGNLYRACQADPTCDLRLALEEMIRSSQVADLTQAQEALQKMGVSMRATGLFDFDQDGQSERWITIQPRPGQSLEFWMLASAPDGVKPLYVDLVTRSRPAPFYSEPVTQLPPVFQIEAQKGFQLKRFPGSEAPYIVPAAVVSPITTYTRDSLQELQAALLSGVEPALVRDSLLDVLNSGRFNCLNHRVCDRFYYNLGLAYELSGDAREAIDTYIKLWWENGQSPYTKIARMKIGLVTPTPSPTYLITTTGTPGVFLTATQAPPAATAQNPYPPPGSESTPNPYP